MAPHLHAQSSMRREAAVSGCGSMLSPYYRLGDLAASPPAQVKPIPPRLPIRHVTVGPSANKSLNVVSVRMLLEGCGFVGVSVEASETSFRS